MQSYAAIDLAIDELQEAGWSLHDMGGDSDWIVYGHLGEKCLLVHAATQSEAWELALAEAQSRELI